MMQRKCLRSSYIKEKIAYKSSSNSKAFKMNTNDTDILISHKYNLESSKNRLKSVSIIEINQSTLPDISQKKEIVLNSKIKKNGNLKTIFEIKTNTKTLKDSNIKLSSKNEDRVVTQANKLLNSNGANHIKSTNKNNIKSVNNNDRRNNKVVTNDKEKCIKCELKFSTRIDLMEHMDTHEEDALYSCNECDYHTLSRRNFERHEWCHVIDAPFQCQHCSYSSISEFAAKRHEKYYHIHLSGTGHSKKTTYEKNKKLEDTNMRNKINVETVLSNEVDKSDSMNANKSVSNRKRNFVETEVDKSLKCKNISRKKTKNTRKNYDDTNHNKEFKSSSTELTFSSSSNDNTLDYDSSLDIDTNKSRIDVDLEFAKHIKKLKSNLENKNILNHSLIVDPTQTSKLLKNKLHLLTERDKKHRPVTGSNVRLLVVWLADGTPNYWYCVECKRKYRGRREANRHTKATHKTMIRYCDIVNCWSEKMVEDGKVNIAKVKGQTNQCAHFCPRCRFRTSDISRLKEHLRNSLITDCKKTLPENNINSPPVLLENVIDDDYEFSSEIIFKQPLNTDLSVSSVNSFIDLPVIDDMSNDTNQLENILEFKRFKCSECVYSSENKCYVTRHIKRVHYKKETNGFIILPYIIDSLPQNITQLATSKKANAIVKSDNQSSTASASKILKPGSDNEPKVCKICPFSAHKDDILKHHMSYHRPNERNSFVCNYCPFYVNSARLLHSHLLLHEPWKIGKSVAINELMNIIHRGNMRSKYFCEYCPYVVNDRIEFWKHHKLHSSRNVPMDAIQCEDCTFWTVDKKLLAEHSALHLRLFCPSVGRLRLLVDEGQKKEMKGLCRCDFAAACPISKYREPLECGNSIDCRYCNYKVSSVNLMRQHIVFHISFSDAILDDIFSSFLDAADSCLFQPCAYANLDIETDYDDMPILERIDYPSDKSLNISSYINHNNKNCDNTLSSDYVQIGKCSCHDYNLINYSFNDDSYYNTILNTDLTSNTMNCQHIFNSETLVDANYHTKIIMEGTNGDNLLDDLVSVKSNLSIKNGHVTPSYDILCAGQHNFSKLENCDQAEKIENVNMLDASGIREKIFDCESLILNQLPLSSIADIDNCKINYCVEDSFNNCSNKFYFMNALSLRVS